MSKPNKVVKSTLMIVIFTLGSKFLGFFREILIAAKFGSGSETDTFFIALTATGLLTNFLSNAISTTFIPIISEVEVKEGKKGKIEHTNNMINVMIIVSIFIVAIAMIYTPSIIRLLARGFQGAQFNQAVILTRIGLPMILFSGIIGVTTGYLQSEGKFTATAIMGFPLNLSYIFFLIFLSSSFGIKGLMVSAVIGVITQLLIQIPELKLSGFKYKFIFNINDEYIKKVLYLSLPVLIGVAINDLNAIIDKTLASSLISGSISALNYANRLNSLILGVFISAITTVIFPVLSKEANNGNIFGIKKILGYGVNLILLITIPATVGLIILSKPIVEIAFQRGEFNATATIMTSQALIFYSIGLVPMALQLLFTRVYYSLQDTKTPMINGFISVIFNVILNIILSKFMGHSGLALATSIASTISTILLIYGLNKKVDSLEFKEYIIGFFKIVFSSIVMGVVVYIGYFGLSFILDSTKIYKIISLLITMGLAITVYGILCYILGIKEIETLIDKTKMIFNKYKIKE